MMTRVYLESTWSSSSSIRGSIIVMGFSPLLQYTVNLFNRSFEVVVDHPLVEDRGLFELVTCGYEPPLQGGRVFRSSVPQSSLEDLPRGRFQEDGHGCRDDR